mmetsp:Transcript_1671/g.3570  ORF Transcript_1671/g.3570 Transcript_1671/m.3570 type:complete len:688 (+) Transcript_1671:717-2780(+)
MVIMSTTNYLSTNEAYFLPRMIICNEGERYGTKTESSMNENDDPAPTASEAELDNNMSKNESQKVEGEDNEKREEVDSAPINHDDGPTNEDHPDPVTDAARSDDAGGVPVAQKLLSKLNLGTNNNQDTDSPPAKPAATPAAILSATTSSITTCPSAATTSEQQPSPNNTTPRTVVIEIEEKDELPSLYVGRIIGKGGEMIRDLQARSGCRIDVLQNHVESNAPKIITYRGRRQEDVDFAKRLVFLLCNRQQDTTRGGGRRRDNHHDVHTTASGSGAVVDLPLGHAVMKEIRVPKSVIGKIIGRGGEMIRELQTVSHARIQVDHSNEYTASAENDAQDAHDANANQNVRMTGVTITGTEESVRRAEEMILFLSNNPGVDGHVLVRHQKNWSEPTTTAGSNFPDSGQHQQGVHGHGMSPPAAAAAAGESNAYWVGGFGGQGPAQALHANANVAGYGSSTSSYGHDQQQQGMSLSWNVGNQYHHSTTPPLSGMVETDTIPCAKVDIGHIIGKRGVTINDLQRRSSCNIQIDQQESQISITGRSRQGIEMAKQMLQEIIERGPNHPYDGGRQHHVVDEQDSSSGQQQQQQLLGYADNQQQSYVPPLHGYPTQQYGMVPHQLHYYGGQHQQPMVMTSYQQQQIQQQAQDQSYPVAAQRASSPWRAATAADGRIYYYNQDTLETQWDTPAGMQ